MPMATKDSTTPVKIVMLTGYLGAGKTTLLNHILANGEGIRAAVIQTPQFAHLFREHNDGNVLCISGRFTSLATNKEIIDEFLATEFGGGRHEGRVAKAMREDDPGFQGVGEDPIPVR